MPMPFAHSLLGASFVTLIYPQPEKNLVWPIIIGGILANAPDFDFILVFLLGSKEWHRGFSHSILFSIFVFLIILSINKFQKFKVSLAYGLGFASHFLLDFVTTKIGGGLELFWFIDSERFGLRWFGLSEVPSKMSATELFVAMLVELMIFLPIFALVYFWKQNHKIKIEPT